MTAIEEKPEAAPVPEGHVRLTIDGVEVIAPKGELLIRTAERLGTAIPRFCDTPLLDPGGACPPCLVGAERAGERACGESHTHPPTHPRRDGRLGGGGGGSPLQNQAQAHGRTDSRFVE